MRPGRSPITATRQSTQFNEVIQLDIVFGYDQPILHMLDECTRFTVATILPGRSAKEICDTISKAWITYFGPPGLIVSDRESGLVSEFASGWAERVGTSLKLRASGMHATMVERHHQVLRDMIHKVSSQMESEAHPVDLSEIVAAATTAKNSLSNIGGASPYQSVLGRTPQLLADLDTPTVSQLSGDHQRMRELAVEAMVEATAKSRAARALAHTARQTVSPDQYAVGQLVDSFRPPNNKDTSGWRGPARVASVLNAPHGFWRSIGRDD